MRIFKKNKAYFALLIMCFLSSCDSTPVINGDKPFIVNQIDEIDNEMSEYYGSRGAGYNLNGFSGRPSIVLPSRLYNIGDTITICLIK